VLSWHDQPKVCSNFHRKNPWLQYGPHGSNFEIVTTCISLIHLHSPETSGPSFFFKLGYYLPAMLVVCAVYWEVILILISSSCINGIPASKPQQKDFRCSHWQRVGYLHGWIAYPRSKKKGVSFTVRSATDRRACRTNDALALCPPSPCGRACPFQLLNFAQSRPLHTAGCAMMDHWRATHTASASRRRELLRLFDMLSIRRFGDQGHCQDLKAFA
jgi:hypothetical protein